MSTELRIWTLCHFDIEDGIDETDFEVEDIGMKTIGYYSSEEMIDSAIARLRSEPEFQDYPDGFRKYDGLLNHDGWRSGFISDP